MVERLRQFQDARLDGAKWAREEASLDGLRFLDCLGAAEWNAYALREAMDSLDDDKAFARRFPPHAEDMAQAGPCCAAFIRGAVEAFAGIGWTQ